MLTPISEQKALICYKLCSFLALVAHTDTEGQVEEEVEQVEQEEEEEVEVEQEQVEEVEQEEEEVEEEVEVEEDLNVESYCPLFYHAINSM